MKKKEVENADNQLNIELKEDVANGKYSNLAIVTHSFSEFVVDFINVMPNMPKAPVVSRIILTPEHAKNLLKALDSNIDKYESVFGEINDVNKSGDVGFPMNYGGPTAEA